MSHELHTLSVNNNRLVSMRPIQIAPRWSALHAQHTGWAQKVGPQTHGHNSVKLDRLKKFAKRFLGKFVVKWILKIPPPLAYVATLPRVSHF